MIILSHPTSNNNVRHLVNGLIDNNLLLKFYTSVAIFPDSYLFELSRLPSFSMLQRRSFDVKLRPYTKTWPIFELSRLISIKMNLSFLNRYEKGLFSIDSVYRSLDRHVSNKLVDAKINSASLVYSYEDGALFTFEKAKSIGMETCYELPIAYWETLRRLLLEEAERLPQWKATIGGIKDSDEKLQRKRRELELADNIVVPSKFVQDSLPLWTQGKRIIMAPFGSPPINNIQYNEEERMPKATTKPLKVLFVGSMSQRKGLGDLFAAFRLLNRTDIELVVMGSMQAPIEFYKGEFSRFRFEPGRPNNEVLELMRSCDIFCLPSIVEGRALVMQEAMSQGLPLIITPNTGGEDLIIEGKTGFLVPIRSPELIAEKLNWCIENRQEIKEMGKFAQQHAAKYTWENYSQKIVNSLFENGCHI